MDEHKPDDDRAFGDGFFGDIEFHNYLGPGNIVEGTVSFVGKTLLAGSAVLGNITGRGQETEIYVGPDTKIEGDIRGDRVVFGGLMNGTIDSPRLAVIKEGVVLGEITTDRGLSVERGARISARITMKKKRKSKDK
jgi:cytoskeletal protein CcmA (bactofilin family)